MFHKHENLLSSHLYWTSMVNKEFTTGIKDVIHTLFNKIKFEN